MLGGDDVGALVLDIGSATFKGGFAGDDTPKAVFPSMVGVCDNSKTNGISEDGDAEMGVDTTSSSSSSSAASSSSLSGQTKSTKMSVGTEALAFRKDHTEIRSPFQNGLITNWDLVEPLLNFCFNHRLHVDPKEHPILMSEPSFTTRDQRERMTELMFEKYEIPAFFIAKSAVLSCFAMGRGTGLVLESGWGSTTAVPVYDGFALVQGDSLQRSGLGGARLCDEMYRLVQKAYDPNVIRPFYTINKRELASGKLQVTFKDFPLTHPSFHEYHIKYTVNDIMRSVCQTSEKHFDPATNANLPKISYELTDGKVLDFGVQRFLIPEIMFRPSLLPDHGHGFKPIQQLICDSIAACDVDIRKELFNGILITGGNTLYEKFDDRLKTELLHIAPSNRLKIVAPNNNVERKFSTWIGGSIVASLGSFHQMWISKAEYEERGRSIVERKCP
eukprot:TRINITY_DN9796_c0_g1_i1.p1 TRINITY_DN9796_c0_g1~~TRINITY_DN9796_c0_g1_i1.p1  ORF type:complete len:445 (-),score=168.55 TRINITY_DN9796_c0_g1_i1:118-1452(-)